MADSNKYRKSLPKKVEGLIELYKKNIGDNKRKMKVFPDVNSKIHIELNAENECLEMTIKELKEIL